MTKSEKIVDLQSRFKSIINALNNTQKKVTSFLGDLNYWKDNDDGSDEWRTSEIQATFTWAEGFDNDIKALVKVSNQIIAWLNTELKYVDEWDSHKLVAELNKGLKRYKLIKTWIPYVYKYIELSTWEFENNSDEVVKQMTETTNITQNLLKQFNDNSDNFWDSGSAKEDDDSDYEEDEESDEEYDDEEESEVEEETEDEEGLDISDIVDTSKELVKLEQDGKVDDQEDELIPEDPERTDRFMFLLKRTHTLYRLALNKEFGQNADIAKFKKQHKIPKNKDFFEMVIFCILCKFFFEKKVIKDPGFTKKENPYIKPKFIKYAGDSYGSFMNTYLDKFKKYGIKPKQAYDVALKIILKNVNKWTKIVQTYLDQWYNDALKFYQKMGSDILDANIVTQKEAYAFAEKYDVDSVDDCVEAYMNWFVMHLIKDVVNMNDEETQDKDEPMLSINPINLFVKQILSRAARVFLQKFQEGFGPSRDMSEILELVRKEHMKKYNTWIDRYNKWASSN